MVSRDQLNSLVSLSDVCMKVMVFFCDAIGLGPHSGSHDEVNAVFLTFKYGGIGEGLGYIEAKNELSSANMVCIGIRSCSGREKNIWIQE
jgi:hypothetical protein